MAAEPPRWLQDALHGSVDPSVVTELSDPALLHLIAKHHNWSGMDVIDELSTHPSLDKGTALLLFWHAEPYVDGGHYHGEPGEDHELEELIERLRSRLVDDAFEHRTIQVDLRRDLEFNRLHLELMRRAGVEPVLREATPGEPFDTLALRRKLGDVRR